MIVEVKPYDEKWPAMFEEEKGLLLEELGDIIVCIHHIGSTAIYGIAAKPIIDILIEAVSLEELDNAHSKFEAINYEALGEFGIPRRRYYRKGMKNRTHQIHAFKENDEHVLRHTAFRDYINSHPNILREYEELKVKLAAVCNNDIEIYCAGKEEFIKYHEAKALEWIKCT